MKVQQAVAAVARECAEALSRHADVWATWPPEDRVRAWTMAIEEKLTAARLLVGVMRREDVALDHDIARTAAEQANKLFGQWMPEPWLNLFIDAYDDIAACRAAGETVESNAAKCRAVFERAKAASVSQLCIQMWDTEPSAEAALHTGQPPEATGAMIEAGIEACDGQLHSGTIRKVYAAMRAAAPKHTGQPVEGCAAVRNFVAQLIVKDEGGPVVTIREQTIPTSIFAALLDVAVPRSAAPASPHEVQERDTRHAD